MKRIVRISLFFVCIIFFLTLTGCKKKYNVVFFDSEKNVVLEEKIKKGKKINEPETPIKEGYNFLGWYDEGEKWDFSSNKVDGDLKLHQKWETISYNITYDLNGGTLEKTNPSNYTIEDSITLNNPNRENYEFIGWTISDSDTPKINISFNGETGDKYYKANYKEKEFTIKLVSNGGSNVENVKYKISDTTIYLGEPTREGYKFIGWYDEYGYPAEIYEYRDYVFYAKWELEQYKITFDSEYSEYFTVEDKDFVLYEPVRIGYKFLGWYENDVLIESLEYRNYDLVARWEIREYILTFNENGGSDVADVKYTINDTEIYVEEPIREGYKFIGWYDEKSGLPIEYCYIGGYSLDDYTFNAKWEIEHYKITFDLNGGSGIDATTFTIEDKTTILNQPIREGYKFIGWYENDILVEDLECRDYNLVAKWEIEYYKITFDSAGGSLVEDIEFTVEDNIVLEEPVCQGLKFLGWYESDTLITKIECRDYELVAKWKKLEVDIEIYEENGKMYVNLGRYPQTLVTDKNLIKELTKIKTTNEKGYIEYNGEEYKREAADPYYIDDEFHDGSSINDNEIYYFKVEPIRWIVLSKNDGTYQLLSQNVLDTKKFYNDYYDRYVNGTTVHPNNYEYSNIRAWLNGYNGLNYKVNNYENKGFLNIAFTEDEQLFINQTLINNSASSTGYNGNIYYCNNTYDKIYLLSAVEADIYDYMYSNNFKYVSDYARAVGCTSYYSSNYKEWQGPWWLRSPESVDRYCACTQGVSEEADDQVAKNGFGVRVALNITIDISSYNKVTFKDYDDKTVKISYVEPEKNAIAPILNERIGYEFIGWDKELTNIQHDLVLEPQYKIIVYKITFDSNGGNSIGDIEYDIEGEDVILPIPEKEGYDFIGWYDENVIVSDIDYKNYNLVAMWIEDKYELTFENNIRYISFGKYPQTVVDDGSLKKELNKISTVNELGYIEYNGKEYKKVVATPYKDNYKFTNDDLIYKNTTYYFLVEPIKWMILQQSDGTYILLSEKILDSRKFSSDYYFNRTINGQIIYQNNYEYSNIRAWLNGYDGSNYQVSNYTNKGFYNIAFSEEEKQLINTTLVDNSLSSTGDKSNSYICNNTNDKVYLLSQSDALNTNYGFSSDYNEYDVARRAQASDYARSKGCEISTTKSTYGNGYWWLRTPWYNQDYLSNCVTSAGNRNTNFSFSFECGVRVVITITI